MNEYRSSTCEIALENHLKRNKLQTKISRSIALFETKLIFFILDLNKFVIEITTADSTIHTKIRVEIFVPNMDLLWRNIYIFIHKTTWLSEYFFSVSMLCVRLCFLCTSKCRKIAKYELPPSPGINIYYKA